MSGILQDGMLGDKEITVRIRSNSHYRISYIRQVGMLIVLHLIRHSWATWRVQGFLGYGRVSLFSLVLLYGRAVLFYPFDFKERKETKMKKTVEIISLILILAMIFSLASCDIVNVIIGKEKTEDTGNYETPDTSLEGDNTVQKTGAWKNATYLCDTEFGTGAKTVKVVVKAEKQSITFTLHTDKDTLGEALMEHGLISGEDGMYGLYIKFVNGIEADYDKDKSYWAFYKNGEYMMSGVDTTVITNGEHYELVKE